MVIKQTPISIHQPLGEESGQTLETMLADNLAWIPEAEDPMEPARQKLNALINVLTETERQVILLSYGLMQGALSDEDEVANQLGLKRSNVIRIKNRAMGALRLAAIRQTAA